MALGAVLFLIGRRRRMDRAAQSGKDRASTLAILGIAIFVGAALSLSRAF